MPAEVIKYGNEKKPLNPFLGELFIGKWEDACGTTELISEQVSHHPPVTAYQISNKKHGVFLQGYNAQKASFSRTINVKQIGHAVLSIPAYNETYLITLPNLHIEGLIFGSPLSNLKPNHTLPVVQDSQPRLITVEKDTLYTVTGQWTKQFEIRSGGKKSDLIDSYDADATPVTPLYIAPIEEQDPLESRRAWSKVAAGIASGDMEATGNEKTKIEVSQRELRIKEKNEGRIWERRYFTKMESCPVLQQLGPSIQLLSDEDKTGGIWRFDETKAAKYVKSEATL
ncbi:hypothetical protein DID88_003491 [Monilinia fructigena]|uniref:Oxysterol-binding protein n=1 Tax=Monilinia fructigena TaxID=38457 RepID=A0A395IVW5_9HELO|nr:hypothetical protein DID88_003491 [Monilinia fructigena]